MPPSSIPCHHPLRCGAVLRRSGRVIPCDNHGVIIPCVAGQFFEAARPGTPKSSPPKPVIIPCVAGQFFEVHRGSRSSVEGKVRHHPLRCGAVLRRPAYIELRGQRPLGHHPLRCGAVLRSRVVCVGDQRVGVESSSPALRGSSSKSTTSTTSVRSRHSRSHHPLRCGAVLRSHCRYPQQWPVQHRHHPLRCGAVLRRRYASVRHGLHWKSSSPALRGSSSKSMPSRRSPTATATSHHPLRCGAVLRRAPPL